MDNGSEGALDVRWRRCGRWAGDLFDYDPAKGAFLPGPQLLSARGGQTATVLVDGSVLLAGGWSDAGMLASTEVYDPASGGFRSAGTMAFARAGHTATRLRDGRVVLAGGGDAVASTTVEIFDPKAQRFTPAGTLSVSRLAHTATLLHDGRVLFAGGESVHGDVLASAELYDPASGKASAAGPMRVRRYKHGAILLEDGRVLLVGGSDERDWRGQYDSAEIYDPKTGSFAPTGRLSSARFKLPSALAPLADGRVLVAGGAATLEAFQPKTGDFAVVGRVESPRYYASATVLADGMVLIVGGYDARPQSSTQAWLFRK